MFSDLSMCCLFPVYAIIVPVFPFPFVLGAAGGGVDVDVDVDERGDSVGIESTEMEKGTRPL
jgi:hypothetical protein